MPKPCSEEYIRKVREWEASQEVKTQEEVEGEVETRAVKGLARGVNDEPGFVSAVGTWLPVEGGRGVWTVLGYGRSPAAAL